MKDLKGKTAYVSGAASGIGRETAHILAQAGAKVVLADVSPGGLTQTRELIEAARAAGAALREHAVHQIADGKVAGAIGFYRALNRLLCHTGYDQQLLFQIIKTLVKTKTCHPNLPVM